jgi:hypothetical protein
MARDIKPARAHFSIGVRLRLAAPDNSENSGGYLGILSDAADRLIDSDFGKRQEETADIILGVAI